MIHRDLKPVNIFLDSNDYPKIGDFGLATRGILSQTDVSFASDVGGLVDSLNSMDEKQTLEFTTKIGTALYIAPELSCVSGKKPYTQVCIRKCVAVSGLHVFHIKLNVALVFSTWIFTVWALFYLRCSTSRSVRAWNALRF